MDKDSVGDDELATLGLMRIDQPQPYRIGTYDGELRRIERPRAEGVPIGFGDPAVACGVPWPRHAAYRLFGEGDRVKQADREIDQLGARYP